MTLWLVVRNDPWAASGLEIMGIFSSHEKAKAACTSPYDCMGPLQLDEKSGEAKNPWPGAYYPAFEKES